MEWKITLTESVSGATLAEATVPTADEDAILSVFRAARMKTGGTLPPFKLDVRHADA